MMSQHLYPSARIYVAGHKGMAGSAIYRALIKSGYGNQSQGGSIITASHQDLDLTDTQRVDYWIKNNRPDVVVLAAAKVGGIVANSSYPADFLLDNLKIQNNVIESAWKHGVSRLLFLGSSCIYPKYAAQPLREELLLSGSLEPTNEWYAIAKIAGIKLCEALRKQHGFDAICLMPTNLYGPGDNYHPTNSHVMPAMIRRFHKAVVDKERTVTCWGTGNPLREFLHVDDLASACVFALEHWSPSADNAPLDDQGQPLTFLNVGTGIDLTIRQLAEIVAEASGYQGEILWDTSKPDGTPRKQLDMSRLTSMGWSASISLKEGIAQTIQLYKDLLLKQIGT